MESIFSSIDFEALLTNNGGRLLWPGVQGLEMRLCQAYHLFAAVSQEAERSKRRQFRRFTYITAGELEAAVARKMSETDEMATLADQVSRVTMMTPVEFIRGLGRDYETNRGSSWVVVMDAECLSRRDGIRAFVELEAMTEQLTAGSGDCPLKTLVFAVFGREIEEMNLDRCFSKELTLDTWVPSDPIMEGTECLDKVDDAKWRKIERSDNMAEELVGVLLEHVQRQNKAGPSLIVVVLPRTVVGDIQSELLKHKDHGSLGQILGITGSPGEVDSEASTIFSLSKATTENRLVLLNEEALNYPIPLGMKVTFFLGWMGPSPRLWRTRHLESNRLTVVTLDACLPNIKTQLQSVRTKYTSVNDDTEFAWVYYPDGKVDAAPRPAASCAEDIQWSLCFMCGPMLIDGDFSDLSKCFMEPMVAAFQPHLKTLQTMGLITRQDDMWQVSDELMDLEQQLLDKGVERTYPMRAAFLWARCKREAKNEVVQRALIRIGAILATGPPSIKGLDNNRIPAQAIKEIWAQCAPFCFGLEKKGYLWVMLGLYEHMIQAGGNGRYGTLTAPATGDGPPCAIYIAHQWVTKITTLVSAVEEMHGILPASQGWSGGSLDLEDEGELHVTIAVACIEDALLFQGNERPCTQGVILDGDLKPVQLDRLALFDFATQKKSFGLAEKIVRDAKTGTFSASGITLMDIQYAKFSPMMQG
ncbi:hypothetical protein MCOR25_004905 [Pyricularia grisea]|nr:hypothetical protein MCOR25_004905 [Pyricularia grisea]